MTKPNITQTHLKELVHYDPETGMFTWLDRPDDSGWTKRYAGITVGTLSDGGYITTRISTKGYKCHRLAFLYMEGAFPPNQVDHINRDRADNRWLNLRHATHTANTRNAKTRKDSTSGYPGVYWYKNRTWRVAIGSTRKPKSHIGYYDTLLDAVVARKQAEIERGYVNLPA